MKVHPISVIIFGSVISLIVSILAFSFAGEMALIAVACLLYVVLGLGVGLGWPINPWRVGIIASIPSMLFLIWRWVTAETPDDAALNISLFTFLPIISLATAYLGAYIGRGMVIRRKIKEAKSDASK